MRVQGLEVRGEGLSPAVVLVRYGARLIGTWTIGPHQAFKLSPPKLILWDGKILWKLVEITQKSTQILAVT